jgi:hypothetical protein
VSLGGAAGDIDLFLTELRGEGIRQNYQITKFSKLGNGVLAWRILIFGFNWANLDEAVSDFLS